MTDSISLLRAIQIVDSDFRYVADAPGSDGWDVTRRGDCEDFCFAVIWELSGRSRFRFAWSILTGPWEFWFVVVPLPDGTYDRIRGGHFVTLYRPTGQMFDVVHRKQRLVDPKGGPARHGWRFEHRYSGLRVLWKVITT